MKEGCPETVGLSLGIELGAILIDGDSEGVCVGQFDEDGASLGAELGTKDGIDEGCPDILGLSLGCELGQLEMDGLFDGCELGIPDKEGFIDGCELGCDEG